MNLKELEKMFDENISNMEAFDINGNRYFNNYNVKQFIFETIIPEVLRKLTLSNETCLCCQNNKQKAKENFGIDL